MRLCERCGHTYHDLECGHLISKGSNEYEMDERCICFNMEKNKMPHTKPLEVDDSKFAGVAVAKQSRMRRFVLDRSHDNTGTSGTGIVAEGVQFSSGRVVIHWLSPLGAVNVYDNAVVLETLHGHGGNTIVRWLDS